MLEHNKSSQDQLKDLTTIYSRKKTELKDISFKYSNPMGKKRENRRKNGKDKTEQKPKTSRPLSHKQTSESWGFREVRYRVYVKQQPYASLILEEIQSLGSGAAEESTRFQYFFMN